MACISASPSNWNIRRALYVYALLHELETFFCMHQLFVDHVPYWNQNATEIVVKTSHLWMLQQIMKHCIHHVKVFCLTYALFKMRHYPKLTAHWDFQVSKPFYAIPALKFEIITITILILFWRYEWSSQ